MATGANLTLPVAFGEGWNLGYKPGSAVQFLNLVR